MAEKEPEISGWLTIVLTVAIVYIFNLVFGHGWGMNFLVWLDL